MKQRLTLSLRRDVCRNAVPIIMALAMAFVGSSAASAQEFAKTTYDMGCVVSNVDAAVKFYTEAIGFQETAGFQVTKQFCTDAGLTDGQPLNVRVLVMGDAGKSNKLKLMHVPGVESKASDNRFVHSQRGYSYITVFVTDIAAAEARLKKAGVAIRGKGQPVRVPLETPEPVYLIVVADPDGNLVELVGPKKS